MPRRRFFDKLIGTVRMSRKVTHMSQVTHIGLSFFGYNRSQVERVIESKDQRISELEKQVADIQAQVTKLQADMVKYQDMEQANA